MRHDAVWIAICWLGVGLAAACQSTEQPSQPTEQPSDDVREGRVPVEGGEVWYRIVGPDRPGVPLLVLHGGPGIPHDYMTPLSALSGERPVVFYDQLGCGYSDRSSDLSLWTIERYVDELARVREALDLERVHILGHSWGSMLAVDYMLTRQPEGVVSLTLAGPALSASRWIADQRVWLMELPEETQEIVREAEASGEFESEAYQAAVGEFYAEHVCRLDPWPDYILRALDPEKMGHDVYVHMWGPSEFTAIGTLKDYERVDRLAEIDTPTLFICGRYDEATPAATEYYHRNLPGSELVIIEGASHLSHAEKPDAFNAALRDFLERAEDSRSSHGVNDAAVRHTESPRGMVSIPGGTMLLGTTADELRELAAEVSDEALIRSLVTELPQHSVEVGPFFIKATEVTNRDWKAFLDATGSSAVPRHPYLEAVLRNGRIEMVRSLEQWRGREIPTDDLGRSLADHPVSGISFNDIQEFCRWAGLRLPSEAEWELAAKGPGRSPRFVWGDTWQPGWCQNAEKPPDSDEWPADGTWPVMFNEKNKSDPYGLFDLAGNVWELTSSPLAPFPGAAPIQIRQGGQDLSLEGAYDPRGRVIKGGGYPNRRIAQRTSVRFSVRPTEWTEAVGFRTARSPQLGLDVAMAVQSQDFGDIAGGLDWGRVRGAERSRWDGDVQIGHEAIVFAPGKVMEHIASGSDWRQQAELSIDRSGSSQSGAPLEGLDEAPLLGMLVTSLRLDESGERRLRPHLDPGSYLLRYVEPSEDFGEPTREEHEEYRGDDCDGEHVVVMERGKPYILFEDNQGRPVATIQLDEPLGNLRRRLDAFELKIEDGLVRVGSHVVIGPEGKGSPVAFSFQLAGDPKEIFLMSRGFTSAAKSTFGGDR